MEQKTLLEVLSECTLDEQELIEYYDKGLKEKYELRDQLTKSLNEVNRDIKMLQRMKNRKISQARVAKNGKANHLWRKNPKWAQTT